MGRAVVTIVAVTGGGADGYGARSPARGVEGADGDPAEGQAVRAAVVDAAVRFAHAYAAPGTKQDAHGDRLGQAAAEKDPRAPPRAVQRAAWPSPGNGHPARNAASPNSAMGKDRARTDVAAEPIRGDLCHQHDANTGRTPRLEPWVCAPLWVSTRARV